MNRGLLFGRFPLIIPLCAAAVCAWVAAAGFTGCGRKAPPLPPHSDPVPSVTDLSHDLQGSRVVLTWTVPDKVRQGAFGEGEMLLSRAKTSLTDELCPECPLVFERVAELPIPGAGGEPKPVYEEEVQRGFRFTYRVVLQMKSGRISEPSNPVEFDY